MNTYRLVWLDQRGNIVKSRHIECRTDQAAVSAAEAQIGDCFAIEVWNGKRPVCVYGNPRFGSDGRPD